MKIKTCKLSGAALDFAVSRATAEGGNDGWGWFEISPDGFLFDPLNECLYSPSTLWKQGGKIIERERIQVVFRVTDGNGGGYWVAANLFTDTYGYSGATPLLAAMRCYVSSKLGPEVEIPEEILSK